MTATLIELRRGMEKWLVVPLAALGILAAEYDLPSGGGIWSLAVSALGTSVRLTGPLAAGAAAYAGTRSRRRGTEIMEDTASRHPMAAGMSELVALLAAVLAAFAITVAVVFIRTGLSATWSGPDVLRTVATAAGLLLFVVCGFVAGRVVPRRFTPLVAAAVGYVVASYGGSGRFGYRWSFLPPVNTQLYDFFTRPNPLVAWGQLLWFSGLGVTVVAGWGLSRRRSGVALTATALLATGVAATGVIVLAAQDGHANEPGTVVEWECRGEAPQICIHPAVKAARSDLTTALLPIESRLAATAFALRRVEQRPRGVGSTPSAGAVGFALDDTRPVSVRMAAEDVAVGALGLRDSCYTDVGPASGQVYGQLLASWALGDRTLFVPQDAEQQAAQRWLWSRTAAQGRDWLSRNQSGIRSCTLSASTFR